MSHEKKDDRLEREQQRFDRLTTEEKDKIDSLASLSEAEKKALDRTKLFLIDRLIDLAPCWESSWKLIRALPEPDDYAHFDTVMMYLRQQNLVESRIVSVINSRTREKKRVRQWRFRSSVRPPAV